MKKNQNGFSFVALLLVFVVILAIGTAGWFVYNNQKKSGKSDKNQNSAQSSNNSNQTNNSVQSMNLQTAPMVNVKYDSSWARLTEFGYPRDGLVKTVDGVAFLISFTRTTLKYDYMDRSAGGAYPVGKLYREITANGKQYFVGTTDQLSSAFLSTCPITANGACSLSLPDNYGFMIVDLQRHTPSKDDYKARSPLVLNNSADKKAIDEFVEIMTTLKF